MVSKIRIKVAESEIEFEGEESYIKNEIPGLLAKMVELGSVVTPSPKAVAQNGGSVRGLKGSTSSIAQKIEVNSGSELAEAAAAKLVIVDGKESFSRSELLSEMQGAKTYYKKTYSNNLSKILKVLVKAGKLSEVGTDTFSIPETHIKQLESVVGR